MFLPLIELNTSGLKKGACIIVASFMASPCLLVLLKLANRIICRRALLFFTYSLQHQTDFSKTCSCSIYMQQYHALEEMSNLLTF